MNELSRIVEGWHSQDLNERRIWYSTVAETYGQVRPRYPSDLVRHAIELAQLPEIATILEIGCGPGTATVAFARPGHSMVCIEPNPDFCRIARRNCAKYPSVQIQNTSFEQWPVEAGRFDAVLAANSIHWIPPEVAYPKAAVALRDGGSLILLWNLMPQPARAVHRALSEVYQAHAPSLDRYESIEDQENNLRALAQIVMGSGRFKHFQCEDLVSEVSYRVDDYLTLLSTYSPYLRLDPQVRNRLFRGLREVITKNFGGRIRLSYLSACQVAKKSAPGVS